MGQADAPHERITPADVVVTEATPRQRELAWRLNGASWASPMDVDSYVQRETLLSQTALSSHGGCKYIVLHRKGDPEAIVSSVEATAKAVLMADGTGAMRKGKGYAIASVYTNPLYRENGMATYMLRSLKDTMDKDSECSALYSDIGTVYYARQGWKVFPSLQVALCLGDSKEPEAPGKARYLVESEIQELCDRDVSAMTAEFEKQSTSAKGAPRVLFLPTWEQINWHFTRAGFMAQVLRGKPIVNRGAATEDGRAWIYWDHEFRENKIKVLRIVTTQQHDSPVDNDVIVEDIKTLLLMAAREAHQWQMPKVLVWNPSEAESEAARRAATLLEAETVFDERLDGSIPSFRWKEGGADLEATVWESNEYYAWC